MGQDFVVELSSTTYSCVLVISCFWKRGYDGVRCDLLVKVTCKLLRVIIVFLSENLFFADIFTFG